MTLLSMALFVAFSSLSAIVGLLFVVMNGGAP
jgi:hypothetical protein